MSPATTTHHDGRAASCRTVCVGGKIEVTTAHCLHSFDGAPFLASGLGRQSAKRRGPWYERTFTARKSAPDDDSLMPFEPHEPPVWPGWAGSCRHARKARTSAQAVASPAPEAQPRAKPGCIM